MRSLFICLLFGWMSMAACGSDKSVPDGVLPPDKMQEVVWDLMRADQFVVGFALPQDSALDDKSEKIKWYSRVLAIHRVSEQQFKESFRYYQTRPDLIAIMMDSIARKEEKIDRMPNRKPQQLLE
ncbi:MAG: DUF4296 domain-containing protein [Sphingomonadales bacterium]